MSDVPERHVLRRTRIGGCSPWTGVLQEARTVGVDGCESDSGSLGASHVGFTDNDCSSRRTDRLARGKLTRSFPQCFGPNEDEPIDPSASLQAFDELRMQIQAETGKEMEMDDMVYGFVKIANETMARPIRTLTEARGFATSKHMYVVISPTHEIAWLMR